MTKKQATSLRPIDAPHYRYWQALYHSFFNPRLYIDVGKRWKGFGILYLLLVMIIGIVPLYWKTVTNMNRTFQEDIVTPLQKLPILYIQNGNVSVNVAMPYFIKNDKNQVVAIVDTTGKINQLENKQYPKLSFLIMKNKFMFRPPSMNFDFTKNNFNLPEAAVTTRDLPQNLNQVFNSKEWIASSKLNIMNKFMGIILYPSLVLVIFSLYLVLLLALALLAQFVAKILIKVNLSYLESFRVLMVSATPQIAITMICASFNLIFEDFGFFSMIVLAVYFSFAAIAIKRASKKMVLL